MGTIALIWYACALATLGVVAVREDKVTLLDILLSLLVAPILAPIAAYLIVVKITNASLALNNIIFWRKKP